MKNLLDLQLRGQATRAISGALHDSINEHGLIDRDLVGSATKRVWGALKSLARSHRKVGLDPTICSCADRRENLKKIDSAVALEALHLRGYSIKTFVYCPYCGKSLE